MYGSTTQCHQEARNFPQYDGVPLKVDANDPLPHAKPAKGVFREEQRAEFQLLNQLNQITAAQYPRDEALRARIKSYELAYRMQSAAPKAVRFGDETQATQELYGLNQPETQEFGRQMLVARRLVEHGCWYTSSAVFMQTPTMQNFVWMRVHGDTIFVLGTAALVLFVANLKTGHSYRKAN